MIIPRTIYLFVLIGMAFIMQLAVDLLPLIVTLILLFIFFNLYFQQKIDIFSSYNFFIITFIVYYGFPIFFFMVLGAKNLDPMRFYYNEYMLLGTICCFLFIFFFDYAYKIIVFSIPNKSRKLNSDIFYFITLIACVNFAIEFQVGTMQQAQSEITISPLLYSILGTFRYLSYLLLAYLLALNLQRFRFYRLLIFIVLFLTLMYFGFISGSKSVLLYPIITVLICYECFFGFSFKKRFFLIIGGILMIPLLLIFQTLREVQLGLNIDSLTRVNYVEVFAKVAQQIDVTKLEGYYYFVQRLNNLAIVSNILRIVDEGGVLLGSTYLRIFWILIPRPFWPDKPSMTYGREFTVLGDYGPPDAIVLGVPMSNTSVGVTLIGESLLNLGPLFIIVAFLMGILFKFLDSLIQSETDKLNRALLAHFIWFNILFVLLETNFAAVFAGAFKMIIFLYLLHKVRIRRLGHL
jgi:hypothetical protein